MGKIEDIALFDLDSTLADYSKAMERDYNLIKSPGDPEFEDFMENPPAYLKERKYFIRDRPGWWENLERFQKGFDILNIARELEFMIYILTKAPKSHPAAWTEKANWVRNHIPDARSITITEDKSPVYGKVLVDDYPPYLTGWLANRPRGLAIIPTQSWNKDFKHPNAIKYDGTNLDQVRKALEIAKKRTQREPLDLSCLHQNP